MRLAAPGLALLAPLELALQVAAVGLAALLVRRHGRVLQDSVRAGRPPAVYGRRLGAGLRASVGGRSVGWSVPTDPEPVECSRRAHRGFPVGRDRHQLLGRRPGRRRAVRRHRPRHRRRPASSTSSSPSTGCTRSPCCSPTGTSTTRSRCCRSARPATSRPTSTRATAPSWPTRGPASGMPVGTPAVRLAHLRRARRRPRARRRRQGRARRARLRGPPRARAHAGLGRVRPGRRRRAGAVLRRRAVRRLDRAHRPARRLDGRHGALAARRRSCRWTTPPSCTPVTARRPRSRRERATNPFLQDLR